MKARGFICNSRGVRTEVLAYERNGLVRFQTQQGIEDVPDDGRVIVAEAGLHPQHERGVIAFHLFEGSCGICTDRVRSVTEGVDQAFEDHVSGQIRAGDQSQDRSPS